MLLSKKIQIVVFKVDDNETFEPIGEVNQFNSLIWPNNFVGHATFELWAPITVDNSQLLKTGHIVWCGGDNAAIIEIVKSTVDKDGTMTYNVKGRTLEALLTTRIIWGTHNATNEHPSTTMYNIVEQNCVNPIDPNRKIPFLKCGIDPLVGDKITIQRTGGEVYDTLIEIATDAALGFAVLFKPHEQEMVFVVVEGVDRTVDQVINDPVEFSTDLEDIISSLYYANCQDDKTVALVLGEGTGSDRAQQVSGNSGSAGFLRRELSVDARDIQSVSLSESGGTVELTPEQYAEALVGRGDVKLAERQTTETFEAHLRVFGDVQYQLGIDYNLGDKVTVRDRLLNVLVSAQIATIEELFDREYSLVLTFGYSRPTIFQRLRQTVL